MIRSDAVYHGRNVDKETDYYKRCDRCKFICKIDRDLAASEGSRLGWGITNTPHDVVHTEYNDGTVNYSGTASEIYNTDIAYSKNDVTYNDGRNATNDLAYSGVIRTIYDPKQKGGCPQCGTYLY